MRKLKNYAVGMLCILLLPNYLLAQTKTITGRVTDGHANPLSGVSVVVKQNNVGTVTDADGKFKLEVPANATVVISSSGFKSQTMQASSFASDAQISLEEDFARLD